MTIGTIYKIIETDGGSFSNLAVPSLTQVIGGGGSLDIYANSAVISGVVDLILRPTLYHSFDNFSMDIKLSLDTIDYEFEFGLFGQQRFWGLNRLLSIKKSGTNTIVEMHFFSGSAVLFQKILPVVFTGDLQIKLVYSNYTWKVAIINQGKVYHLSYKYKKELNEGHTTSKFLFTNIVGTITIKKIEVKVNCPKNSTVFIGDSISYGSSLPFGGLGTFPQQYSKANLNTTIFASSAASSLDVVNDLASLNLIEAEKVFILIGDNDPYTDIPAFISNLTTILNGLSSVGQIYLMNMTPETVDEGYADSRDAINSMTLPSNTTLIDSWSALARIDNPNLVNPIYTVDHVHLNQLGHNTMYQLLQNY